MSARFDVPLVLWAGCVSKRGIIERAEGLRAAGFVAMTLFAKDLSDWEECGGTLARLRRELDVRQAAVVSIDTYLGWYPGYEPSRVEGERAAFVQATEADVMRFAEATGATSVSLVAPGRGGDVELDAVVDSLGRFADRAGAAGLGLHLEVVPSTNVPNLATATCLVGAVARPNLGLLLDTYNLARSGVKMAELDVLPSELAFGLQLADGTVKPLEGDYGFDSLHGRRQPGEGELAVADIARRVMSPNFSGLVGPEVLQDELSSLPANVAARRCAQATRRFLRGLRPGPCDGEA